MITEIRFVDIKTGDPLPAEAAEYPRGDRRRLAAALRQLCPDLTEEEATALSLKPPAGSPANITVQGCKDLILRELPALREAKPPPEPTGDYWDDGTGWDDPVDAWPKAPNPVEPPTS